VLTELLAEVQHRIPKPLPPLPSPLLNPLSLLCLLSPFGQFRAAFSVSRLTLLSSPRSTTIPAAASIPSAEDHYPGISSNSNTFGYFFHARPLPKGRGMAVLKCCEMVGTVDFLLLLHSRNLCISVRCRMRSSQSASNEPFAAVAAHVCLAQPVSVLVEGLVVTQERRATPALAPSVETVPQYKHSYTFSI
jgi:hypothetical protein